MKPIIYIDLDGVVADFDAHVHLLGERDPAREECKTPEHYFTNLPLIEGSVEALGILSEYYDLYFLSTPQWSNPYCWMEKRLWVETHFGKLMFKRLILTHHKRLLKGDYLIDDNVHEGFEGEHIHFGTAKFPDWDSVVRYLTPKNFVEGMKQVQRMREKSLGIGKK
jgi:5'(3')-deoxyribonucleotidase